MKFPSFAVIMLASMASAQAPLPSSASSTSESPPPTRSPSADFSEGFKQIAALGLPILTPQARWIRQRSETQDYDQLRNFTKSAKGNTWLISSQDGTQMTVALGAVAAGTISKTPSATSSSPPDVEKDAAAVIAALKKAAGKSEDFSERLQQKSIGSLLVFATQLHQTGHTATANELASNLFSLLPQRDSAIDAAISLIADHSYDAAADAFFTSGDWAAYHTTLAELLKRFPRGWSNAPAIAMFLPQLEKQASGAKPAIPQLDGIPIDPLALDLVLNLAERPKAAPTTSAARPPSSYYHHGDIPDDTPNLWIISEQESEKSPTTPVQGLTALRLAALPALAALVSDPFLTHLPNPQSFRGNDYSSNESPEEQALQAFQTLRRPSSRGEIAQRLLAATLPDPDGESNETDPESLRDLALAFWKQHQNATREQLAAVFLTEGSRSQASIAANMLANSKNPEAHKQFETHILASDSAISYLEPVQFYLKSRKSAAKSFCDAYAKLLRTQTEGVSEDEDYEASWRIKQAGSIEKLIKSLESLVQGQSPRARAVEIAKGPPEEARTAIGALQTLLADATPTKQLYALLEGAAAADDALVRARFLAATHTIQWPGSEIPMDSPTPPPPDRSMPATEIKVWQKLIADTREIPRQLNRLSDMEKPSVSEMAAASMEYSISPAAFSKAIYTSTILGKPFAILIGERAAARLAGQPLPAPPDPSTVSDARLSAIVAEVAKLPSSAIHPHLTTLPPDERAAWLDWCQDPDDLPLPQNVRDLRFVVTGRSKATAYYSDAPGAGSIDSGFTLNFANIKSLVATLAADLEKHSRTSVQVFAAPFPPGLQVQSMVIPFPKNSPEPENPDPEDSPPDASSFFHQIISQFKQLPEASGIINLGLFVNPSTNVNCTWLIKDGKAFPATPDEMTSLENALKAIQDSPANERMYLRLQILSKSDSEKLHDSED